MMRLALLVVSFAIALLSTIPDASAHGDEDRDGRENGNLEMALLLSVPNAVAIIADIVVLEAGVRRSNFGPIFGYISGALTTLIGLIVSSVDLSSGLIMSVSGIASLAFSTAAVATPREQTDQSYSLFLGR